MTKNHRYHIYIWLLSAVFLVMQYAICLNVFVMGDDYMYGTFGHMGIIQPVFSYYFTGNGRWLINILDSLWLLLDRYLYIVLMPWLLLLFCILIYRFICVLTNKNHIEIYAFALGLLSIIDVLMTCETTYWITGSMNYLIPAIFLVAGMTATLKLRNDQLSTKEVIVNSILCVLSCLTMEQYGLMAIGWMLLIWGYDWIKHRRANKRNIVVFILSFVALSTIVFAPGNFIRVDAAANATIETSLFIKTIDLIYDDYYSKVSSIFVFILASISAYKHFKAQNTALAILSLLNAIVLLLFFDYRIFSGRFYLVITSVLISICTILPLVIKAFKKHGLILFCSLAIIGLGSQLMLLKTILWGFRTSFCWILIYIIIALILINDNYENKDAFVYSSILFMSINLYCGIVGLVILCIKRYTKKVNSYMPIALLVLTIIIGLTDEVIGYNENRDIHTENIKTVEYANKNDISRISILPYDDQQYGWTSPPLSEFHEKYFRSYYGIPDDVSIGYAAGE